MRRFPAMVVVVLGLAGVTLAACSSNSTSPTTSTTSRASGTSPGSSTTISSRPASTTTTRGGPPVCAASALDGSIVGSSGAAGTIETTVALKSTAPATCILGGYPGLLLLGSSGSALPTKVVRGGSYSFTSLTPTTVTLTTGGSVYFNIGYSDVPVGGESSCPTSTSLEITPPNDFDHLVLTAALAPCGGGTLVVSPVFATTSPDTRTTAPSAG
jgi:Protein of unknown function (DUF4232)